MSKQQQTKAHKIQPRGFTLIELLVVISVISILMSILLPSLSKAREQAQRVACLANLDQLTVAWMIYAGDYEYKLCSADTGWNDTGANHWVADGFLIPGNKIGGTEQAIEEGVLWPYTEHTLDLYKCPTDRTELLRSYAISRAMNGKTCNCEGDNIKPFRTLLETARPGEKMVFIDASSQMEWIENSFCAVKEIDAIPPQWFRIQGRNITARHGGGCNLSFADGHCEYRKWEDPRTVKLANWEIDPANASANNPDLDRMVQLLTGRWF